MIRRSSRLPSASAIASSRSSAVALGVAAPTDATDAAAGAAVGGVDALIRRVGQRHTLTELGITPEQEPRVVQDGLADPAIRNSPRLPTRDQARDILASVLD